MVIDEHTHDIARMAETYRGIRAALETNHLRWEASHPMLVELQQEHAERLNGVFDAVGWPGPDVPGRSEWATSLLLHNLIGSPEVMRRGLGLLRAAERCGRADRVDAALCEDRVLALEGRPQLYGTELDWDDDGTISPHPIANPEDVDIRRRAVGLDPLANSVKAVRVHVRRACLRPPDDLLAYRAVSDTFARSVGWR